MRGRRRDMSYNDRQFQPKPTTVQNVPLIPGYFDSSEENEAV